MFEPEAAPLNVHKFADSFSAILLEAAIGVLRAAISARLSSPFLPSNFLPSARIANHNSICTITCIPYYAGDSRYGHAQSKG